MSPTPLPGPISFLTNLFTSLESQTPATAPHPATILVNPLLAASATTRAQFLTLHCVFPTELLPALDLLDRGLVTRLVYWPRGSGNSISEATLTEPVNYADALDNTNHSGNDLVQLQTNGPGAEKEGVVVYCVRSSHPNYSRSSSRYHHRTGPIQAASYEVRLSAWNCTCAAFTFSAFNSNAGTWGDGWEQEEVLEAEAGNGEEVLRKRGGGTERKWQFGGALGRRKGGLAPVCKHLLACVLLDRWTALERYVEERVVGREEMAGWGGGWGR